MSENSVVETRNVNRRLHQPYSNAGAHLDTQAELRYIAHVREVDDTLTGPQAYHGSAASSLTPDFEPKLCRKDSMRRLLFLDGTLCNVTIDERGCWVRSRACLKSHHEGSVPRTLYAANLNS